MQQSLVFADEQNTINCVPDLIYKNNYISKAEERELLHWINSNLWLEDLTRRVQHYGWKYDYKARKIDSSMWLGELPKPLLSLAKRIYQDGLVAHLSDQVIINEYQPGQGIADHIDCETCFDDDIVTISLNADYLMEFTQAEKTKNKLSKKNKKEPKHVIEVWLHNRSIAVMKGESRWWWFHGIKSRKNDKWQGISYPRNKRVSLTFRKIVTNS